MQKKIPPKKITKSTVKAKVDCGLEQIYKYIHTNGKAWQIETDNLCNDGETLQNYTRHAEQQSDGRRTHASTVVNHL